MRRNRGAPGIDRKTIADVEEYGVTRLLDELAADLREQRIPAVAGPSGVDTKPGCPEQRPLSIPAVRDRIVQAALKTVIEPVFEADFQPVQFRVPAQAVGARCPAGPHRRVIAGQTLGGRDGHRQRVSRRSRTTG